MSRLIARPLLPLAAGAVAVAALAGCGSSTTVSSSTPTEAVPATTAAPATDPTTAAPTTAAAPAVSSDQFATGTVPAVDGATDLKAAPTIHAGVGTAPTSLVGADLVIGTGPVATSASTVNIQYVGTLFTTGATFDSSWSRGQPASFPLSQVIPGFAQGITGMKVGGRRELVIPPSLGYGAQANQGIPANSTLVFVIDLLSVS